MGLKLTNAESATTDAKMRPLWRHTLKIFTETTSRLTG